MIIEREIMMSKKELKNPEWFPPYIIVKKPFDRSLSLSQDDDTQWQGFVKAIDRNMKIENDNQFSKINQRMKVQDGKINTQIQSMQAEIQEIKQLLQSMNTKLINQ